MAKGFGPPIVRSHEVREIKIIRRSVMQHFQQIKDPRMDRTKRHSLMAIITIAILAVLAGADGFVAIKTYGKAKQAWLEKFLDLPYGIPSHDTFARVLAGLEPNELQASFLSWVSSITEKLSIELIHIDGKTTKGSYDREGQLKALHSVSAWSSEHGLVLGQQKVGGRSNEITAVPLLLQLLNLKGVVVTLDAMGTQTAIAVQIKQAEGEYVLALKGNQGKLNQQVEAWFKQAQANGLEGIEYSYDHRVETGHHRIETRQAWAVPMSQLSPLHRQSQWLGLTTVVMVKRTRQLWNQTTTEVCFYISSLEADAARHNQVIRSHWSIENSLHWGGVSAGEASPAEPPLLDVTFNEDASRIRSGHAPENLSLLRRLSVNLLKREPSNLSLAMKRYKAGMDNEYKAENLSSQCPDLYRLNTVVVLA